MELSTIAKIGGRVLGRGTLYIQKFSPEILTAVGVIGVVGAAVLASRATLKLENVIETGHDRVLDAKTSNDPRNGLAKAYGRNAFDIVKLYGPSVTLGAVSIVCIVSAHGLLNKRNAALAAAYKSIESAYTAYRERVIEEYGADKDKEFRYDIRTQEITDPDTGKKKKVTGPIDPLKYSPNMVWFDKTNHNWVRNLESNLTFLTLQQNYFNHRLQAVGHVFLNEVYEALGFPHTREGSFLGWLVDGTGDQYIDFGLYNDENSSRFYGPDGALPLDFNVDGSVWDKI